MIYRYQRHLILQAQHIRNLYIVVGRIFIYVQIINVYYMSIPDIAWGEENGESKPMGTIDGKSCFIPVVSCENKNPRNVLTFVLIVRIQRNERICYRM